MIRITRIYDDILPRDIRIIEEVQKILIIALGLDIAKEDPTGSWSMLSKDFKTAGRMIGSLKLPTIVIQEGGYRKRSLGVNAYNFFLGLWEGTHSER